MQHDAFPVAAAGARPAPVHERPRIVVAGEFGAGKSGVINAMLRRPFLPFDIGASNRPLISVYHATETGIVVTPWTGAPFEVADFAEIPDIADVQGLAIRTPMPGLEGVEIVELPFHHDGVVEDGVIEMMAAADLLIWVTIASQAWRLTEQAVVERLPAGCRAKSVLAISRADKLRCAEDRHKIETRIRRECGALLAQVVFMQASGAVLQDCAGDDRHWSASGGRTLLSIAQATIGTAARAPRPLPDHVRASARPTPDSGAPPDRSSGLDFGPDMAAETDAERPGSVIAFTRHAAAIHPARPARPAPPKPTPAADLPVFLRSGRIDTPPRPAELTSQHVRDAVSGGRGRRPAEAVTAEIEDILRQTSGLDAAGIGNFRDMQVVKSFRGTGKVSVDANVLATAICLNSAVSASAHVVPGEAVEEVSIKVGNQVFLIVPIDLRAGTFAFLAVQSNRVNPAIMRVLLRRVVALWSEIRRT